MRILVTGAKGMLGTALLPCLKSELEVVGVDLKDFDISQEAAVQKAFRDLRPDFVFHLAAYTDVDGCEAKPEMAMQVNAQGTRNVAKSCAEIGAVLLYVSTDYVFDGSLERPYREDDRPNPISIYGKSKLGGEQHVRSLLARHFIVRSSWLYGPRGKNFVATILKLAQDRDELRVVSDQRGSPTYTQHLALKLAKMLRIHAYGIYHMTGAGSCSWFEFAQAVLKLGGLDRVRVVPISTQESGRRAPRPANSVLENCRLIKSHLGALPHWTEGLAQYLKEGQHVGDFVLPSSGLGEKPLPREVTGVTTVPPPQLVEERRGVRLVIVPHAQPGCGDIISDPRAPQLIQGVEVEPLTQFPDDRGLFAELFRFGEPGIGRDFDSANGSRIQVSFTISYPGVIKAIHYHFEQTDLWAPLSGMFQVFLCDLRESSPTCGRLNTIFVGAQRPWKLRIPPGVAHGYKIVGTNSGMLVYATNRTYNPKDEGRIPFDDPGINYDWVTRPK